MSCLCEASLSKYDLFRSRSVSQEVWPELATAKTELSHRHCLRRAISATQFIFKIEKVEVRWHKVSQCEIENVIYDWRPLRPGGRWPRSPSTSHRLPWPGFCLSNAPFKWSPFASFAWLNISTIHNPTPPRWWLELQCATSRHYLVNCSCTVGLCKNGQFRSH